MLSILNAIGEGVCLLDARGRMIWSNEVLGTWHAGLLDRIAELCRDRGGPLLAPVRPSISNPDGTAQADVLTANLILGDREFEVTLRPLTLTVPAAGPTPASAAAVAEPSDAGQTGGMHRKHLAAVVRDVSASRAFRRKIEAIDAAGASLVEIDAEAVRKLNPHERLKALENKIVRLAHELLNFDHFAIRLLDEKTGKLELVLGAGLPPEFNLFDIYARTTGSGISGFVAATGRSYVCPDVAKDDLFLPGVTGARSSLTVALRLHDKVIGILNVESLQPNGFTETDRQLAEIFARYIAMALHILDRLVVERSTTNQHVSGRVAHELEEPLKDILQVVGLLQQQAEGDEVAVRALDRIQADVVSIQDRVRACALGPTTLLGVEKALADRTVDPLFEGRSILVADDEIKIRRIIGDVLRHRGCEVTVCESGSEAMEAIAARQRQGLAFDMVISDIRMPDRNGYEVFAAARRAFGEIAVILMTGFGYDPHHSIVRASQEGLQAVLFKPFQVERLLDEVRKTFLARAPKAQ